jgi:hypothetical protein
MVKGRRLINGTSNHFKQYQFKLVTPPGGEEGGGERQTERERDNDCGIV